MKCIKLPLFMTALMLTVCSLFASAQDEVTAPKKVVKKAEVSYHYKISSGNLADMQNINNWEVASASCGIPGNRPCVILFEGDVSEFETYLQTFTSAGAITTRADEKKSAP